MDHQNLPGNYPGSAVREGQSGIERVRAKGQCAFSVRTGICFSMSCRDMSEGIARDKATALKSACSAAFTNQSVRSSSNNRIEHHDPGSTFPVTGQWHVSFAEPDKDAPCGPVLVFDSLILSCDERRIKISMGKVLISHVHSEQTWDTVICQSDGVPVNHALARDEKKSLLLKLLLPIAIKLTGERIDILWNSIEIQMDKMNLTYRYAVDGAKVAACIVSSLTMHCYYGVEEAPCIIKTPGFSVSGETELVTFQTVAIFFDSAASMRRCLRSILSLVDWLEIAVRVSKMSTSTTDGWMSGTWTDITRTTCGSGSCTHLSMTYMDGTTLALSGFSFDITGACTVEALDTLYIPGICSLSRKAIVIRSSLSERIVVKLSAVHMILLRNLTHKGPTLSWPSFPCLEVFLDEVVVEYQGKIVMQLHRCCVAANKTAKGLEFSLSCDFLESRMISSITSSMSGCFTSNDVLSDLRIRPGAVSLITDIRTFDWSLISPSQENAEINMIIPLGIIESFSLSVDLQNAMLSTEKPHVFPSFQGGPNATTDDFGEYVVKLCVNEFPKLYAKTRVMGERATDLTAKAAGRLASSSVAFSALGSISALVLTDAVRALSKQTILDSVLASIARNSTNVEDDSSHRKEQQGVMGRLQQYIEHNRTRFGSAAGSAFGIAIGTALYGLPGMMLGNIMGGKLVAAAMGQFPVRQDATRRVLMKEDTSCEWVFVDMLSSFPESRMNVEDKENLMCVQSRGIAYPLQEPACPSAPLSDGTDFEGPQRNNKAVPAYLQPANSIGTSEGYIRSLQQRFFVFVRRHRKESQWRLHQAIPKTYQR